MNWLSVRQRTRQERRRIRGSVWKLAWVCTWALLVVFVLGCNRSQSERAPQGKNAAARGQKDELSEGFLGTTGPSSSGGRPNAPKDPGPGIFGKPVGWAPLPEKDSVIRRVTFGSCGSQYRMQGIWTEIEKTEPDLFLHLGDMIYADVLPHGAAIGPEMDVVEKARMDYGFWAAQAPFRHFAEGVPMMLVWDDHDSGKNDGGAAFPRRAEMKELLLEFAGAAASDPRRTRAGVYHARSWGPEERRVQVILLDTRSFRSPLLADDRSKEEKERLKIVGKYAPNTDPAATLLGAEQWQWLKAQFEEPARVRLLASSIQIVASEKGIESWGNFPRERQRLYSLIRSTDANGVILLSGDTHFAEISKTSDGPYPLYDFTSSNLAQAETRWAEHLINSYRTRGPLFRNNFGMVEIDWDRPDPLISLRAFDSEGDEAFRQDIALSTLQSSGGQ